MQSGEGRKEGKYPDLRLGGALTQKCRYERRLSTECTAPAKERKGEKADTERVEDQGCAD